MGAKPEPNRRGVWPRQALRKPTAEEDGKRREEESFALKEEEDGPEEDDGFQTGRIIRFSDRR
jgi:hypothetical protein